ncbi:hypothetical protein BDY17DRAFT_139808 [Neohortaea acidophila]|uniref:Uncharacterized protein n=1 Tax=Neohortaea acidophila TaxID=245834 RepID=A0A6A6PU78_9PEZI|nr:uncharacterized protein BDY17DRAFT_139808 [Neohortaea acidophila]KAF2483023.1 hypothetical protein BDY17DRAFT_139808 [Neohortaea acidophila]
MLQPNTFGVRMGDWLRYILSCCDEDERGEEERPALQISAPTNFRREDISIPGLTAEQQHFLREKAKSDAEKMWPNCQPLRSSPSCQFTSPAPTQPTWHNGTAPRSNTTTVLSALADCRTSGGGWDRVKAHSRKISNSLTKPSGYHHDNAATHAAFDSEDDSRYEMRALMDSRNPSTVGDGKLSGERSSLEDGEM